MDTKESLNELNAALEAGNSQTSLVQGAALQVNSLDDLANKYLSDESKKALSNKSVTQFVNGEDGKTYKAVYLSCIVGNADLELGAKALSEVANKLAERGLVHSCLAPISSLQLATQPMLNLSSVVFLFPLVPSDREQEVNEIAGELKTMEGGLGPNLTPKERVLPSGQFFAEVYVTLLAPSLVATHHTKEEVLKDAIQEYLNILPKGTEVISATQCSVYGLGIPYEVILYNPLMQDYKKVKLNYSRAGALVDGSFKQFNLFHSVEYTKRDGTVL